MSRIYFVCCCISATSHTSALCPLCHILQLTLYYPLSFLHHLTCSIHIHTLTESHTHITLIKHNNIVYSYGIGGYAVLCASYTCIPYTTAPQSHEQLAITWPPCAVQVRCAAVVLSTATKCGRLCSCVRRWLRKANQICHSHFKTPKFYDT